ncbi:hypothetical protein WJX82_002030 [Trebouxia sp. C0006]
MKYYADEVRQIKKGLEIWFLADVRRLTVALTRAHQGLIVIGSKSTLMNNQPESFLLRWAGYRDVTTFFCEKRNSS